MIFKRFPHKSVQTLARPKWRAQDVLAVLILAGIALFLATNTVKVWNAAQAEQAAFAKGNR